MMMPRVAPMNGCGLSAPSIVLHMMAAVSRPSRPTVRKATSAIAPLPRATAEAISPSSSFLRPRAVRRIQKIIQVTSPAARIDRVPPTPSWALNDSCSNASVMNVNDRDHEARARRATPIHT